MARRNRGMPKPPPVRGNTRAPNGAVLTGEQAPDGRPIYRIKRKVKVGVQPMLDQAGRPVMRRTQPGLPPEQRLEPVMEERTIEFIIDDLGNGMCFMNAAFRPDPAEAEAQERARRREAAIDRLGDLAEEMDQRGIRPGELLKAIRGEGEEPEPAAVATSDTVPKPERKAPNGKRDILDNAKARLKK